MKFLLSLVLKRAIIYNKMNLDVLKTIQAFIDIWLFDFLLRVLLLRYHFRHRIQLPINKLYQLPLQILIAPTNPKLGPTETSTSPRINDAIVCQKRFIPEN